jgi:putative protein kinase ArgK-like GTPase of G3E family
MDQLTEGINKVYDNREKYIIIGLTGRTGSGCSTSAKILSTPRELLKLAIPQSISKNENEARKFSTCAGSFLNFKDR